MTEASQPVDFSSVFGNEDNTAKAKAFENLAAGFYQGRIVDSGSRTSKKGFQYLSMTIELLASVEGNPAGVKGRRMFTNFNLWHTDPTVRERAKSDLRDLASACQLPHVPPMSTGFHNIPLLVKVTLKALTPEEIDKGYEPKNDVGGYKPLRDVAPAPAAFVPPVAAAAWQPSPVQSAPAAPWTPPAVEAPAPAVEAPVAVAAPPARVLDASKPPWAQ